MIYAINSVSAFEFWRNARCQPDSNPYSFTTRALEDLPKEYDYKMDKEMADFLTTQLKLSPPLYLMAPSDNRRCKCSDVINSVRPKNLLSRSFIEVPCPGLGPTNKVLIACPELCFLQLAPKLHFDELVRLGFELCGTYIFDAFSEYGQSYREQITTADSIKEYVYRAHDMKGLVLARQASKYILDKSNSPMESKIIVNAIIPFLRGGYAAYFPELNEHVPLSVNGIDALRQKEVISDALWKMQHVSLEYDSNLAHLTSDQHARDQNRANALSLSGYKLLSFTREDFKNFENSEQAFISIRDALGMRNEKNTLKKYADRRNDVFERLFGSKESWIFRV